MDVERFTAEAVVFVTDMPRALNFYESKLKFAVRIAYGTPVFFAQVERGGARLNLRHVDSPIFDPNVRDEEELLSAVVIVDSADRLFAEYSNSDVMFQRQLRTESWGARTFLVRDPDGNLVLFAS